MKLDNETADKKIIIASDFHLKYFQTAENSVKRKKILDFLQGLIGEADILILNGDIFDLWYTWKTVIIKGYFDVLKVLADLKESGCRVVYVAGNHDFLFRDFFTNILKIEIHKDHFTENLNGYKFFVSHGDQYTKNDIRYRIFRSLMRSKFVMKFFEIIHPDFGLRIGLKMSRTSRKVNNRKKYESLIIFLEKQLEVSAKELLEKYDVVVFSHSHNPKKIDFENGIYLNSGDWVKNFSYIKIIGKNINLEFF